MRKLMIPAFLAAFASATPVAATEADLTAVMTAMKGRLDGTAGGQTIAQINAWITTIDSNDQFIDDSQATIAQAINLVALYDVKRNPLFTGTPTKPTFPRTSPATAGEAEAGAIIRIMQALMDHAYGAAELALYADLFDGAVFKTSSYFPGAVNPPANPNAVYSVQINASQPVPWGYPVLFGDLPARRPTGAYLPPGCIATVTVPPALVNQGFQIRVGAHIWDLSAKSEYKRMDRVSLLYPITSIDTKIVSPLGGGIYIEVPYGAVKGIVTVSFKNTVRSPFYSNSVARQTTLTQWQNTERTHPGPWADFESDKTMFNIPRNFIYNYDDPVTMMKEWDLAMDAVSDMQGLPRIRPKTVLYGQVDVLFKSTAGAPGYPQSNQTWNPAVSQGGDNTGHYYLYGPKFADQLHLHELGHGMSISKFTGETEAAVNLPYVAVHNRKFGVDLDEAFGRSVGNEGCASVTRDQAALMWILDPDFRAGMAMNDSSMRYQHRGYGKYVEIAALFGWKALGDFWKSVAVDYENGKSYPTNSDPADSRILRMSRAAGVDLTPLIHFWGVRPVNASSLKASIAAEGLLPSPLIYERLLHYRNIVPHTQSAFNTHFWAVNAAPRDNAWYDAQKAGYDTTVGTQAVAGVQAILNLYFPNGRPADPPLVNPVVLTENFNGTGGPLDYKSPTSGKGAWIANSIVTDNGTLTADGGSAMLRFDPVPNRIYTLSMDFNYSSGSGGWLGLGFSSTPPTACELPNGNDRFSNAGVPGSVWMISNTTGITGVWQGPRTANPIPYTSPTLPAGPHTLKIIVDTTGDGSFFTADFFIDGLSVTGGPKLITATTLEAINYVGFTQYGGGSLTGSTVANFSLLAEAGTTPPVVPTPNNYTETFNGAGGALNGRISTTGGTAWSSNSIVTDNGVLTASAGSALLPFNPDVNKLYTLSIDFNYNSGTGGWLGLGFSSSAAVSAPGESSTADRFSNANVPGYAWINFKGTSFDLWQGPRAANAITQTSPALAAGSHNLKVILDTTGDANSFKADFFIDGASVTNGPATINLPLSTLQSAGFTQYGDDRLTGSTVDNFSLVTGITPQYQTWVAGFGLTGSNANPLYDYDGDGFNNLLEFAQNGNPTQSSNTGTLPTGHILKDEDETSWFELVHVERAIPDSGLTYTLEVSDQLTNASFIPCADAVFVGETVTGDYKTVTHRIPVENEFKRFFRMKVEH